MEQENKCPAVPDLNRRTFISAITKAAGSAVLLSTPIVNLAENFVTARESWTVGKIMDLFIGEVPGAPFQNTVDTLKSGDRDSVVTAIVTTMFATLEVIEKTIGLKANFIIAHEPTFYNHLDETKWLEHDEVYQYKAALLKKHNIAIWRNHDYIHRHMPDGVRAGVISQLDWGKFYDSKTGGIDLKPAVPLKSLMKNVKQKLNISTVRYIGDPSQICQKVLLMPGASGGRSQITAIGSTKPDVILCGELSEWETAEYVRDARTKGDKLALVIMGHAPSEEPGSEYMRSWLREKLPGMQVTHIPSNNPLSFF